MRGQALGYMGQPDVKTPNLDRLAAQGVTLPTTFANTPLCCPGRATMLTGTYPHRHGVRSNDLPLADEKVTIAEILRAHGYRTGFIGKWHLDGGPRLPGFIPPGLRRHGYQAWAANECNHNYFYNWHFRDVNVPIVTRRYMPEVWTDLVVEFLYQAQTEQPFFLMVAPGAPHDPCVVPEKYLNMYNPEALKMRPN